MARRTWREGQVVAAQRQVARKRSRDCKREGLSVRSGVRSAYVYYLRARLEREQTSGFQGRQGREERARLKGLHAASAACGLGKNRKNFACASLAPLPMRRLHCALLPAAQPRVAPPLPSSSRRVAGAPKLFPCLRKLETPRPNEPRSPTCAPRKGSRPARASRSIRKPAVKARCA